MIRKRIIHAAFVSCAVMMLLSHNAEAGKIMDNSFLLEEAYNQEPGVIQHIQTFQYMKNREWAYSFTQEWPVPGQTHQFSYTIPVYRFTADDDRTGIGDVLINYRYQAVSGGRLAIAPRLSAVVPSGDYKKEFGRGAPGVQANLPVSLELSDSWVTHWNAGITYIKDAKEPGGEKADTADYNAGASVIWLLTDNFNFMLETVYNSMQSVKPDGGKSREDTFTVNPGFRFAINFESGLQIVPGVAMPVVFKNSETEYNLFAYLSFEHPLF